MHWKGKASTWHGSARPVLCLSPDSITLNSCMHVCTRFLQVPFQKCADHGSCRHLRQLGLCSNLVSQVSRYVIFRFLIICTSVWALFTYELHTGRAVCNILSIFGGNN